MSKLHGTTAMDTQVQQRLAVFRLAPGYQYTVQVGEESKVISLEEMPKYLDSNILLERVKLQYYRVKSGGEIGSPNETDHIAYSPLLGSEGERGYQLRLSYKMPSGEETDGVCFLIFDHFQESLPIMFTPSEWIHFSDVSLNEAIKTNSGIGTLTYKVYADGCLLTQGSFDIVTE